MNVYHLVTIQNIPDCDLILQKFTLHWYFEYDTNPLCINIFKPKKHNIFETYPNLNLVIAIKIP